MQFVKSVIHSSIVQLFANCICFSRTSPTYVRSRFEILIVASNLAHETNCFMDYMSRRGSFFRSSDGVCAVNDLKAGMYTSVYDLTGRWPWIRVDKGASAGSNGGNVPSCIWSLGCIGSIGIIFPKSPPLFMVPRGVTASREYFMSYLVEK